MTDFFVQALQTAQDQAEKAAIIAEAAFALLSKQTAMVARRCVILHWFDQTIIEAFLEDSELTLDEMSEVYSQLTTLPFIDTLPWGLAFHDVTREGLLKKYSLIQPELLQSSTQLAAPAYEMREEDRKSIAEAFYCYIIAGDRESGTDLQNILFEIASSQLDWQYLNTLLQLQAEAESLPFVQPLPRTGQQFLLQGLLHRIQGKSDAALLDYEQAINLDPTSILAYMSRGITYTEQGNLDLALKDYNAALKIDRNFAPAYLGRGIIYTKQGKYKEALRENNRAWHLGLNTEAVLINKGNILNELGQYEDALVTYNDAIQLNRYALEAYTGKGQSLNGLARHVEALEVYEQALLLNPGSVDVYIGKGWALNGLQRYVEALVTCTLATQINPNIADIYRVQAHTLRSLKRYAEASEASKRANELDPVTEEEAVESTTIVRNTKDHRQSNTTPANQPGIISFLAKFTNISRPSNGRTQKRTGAVSNALDRGSTIPIIVVIILAAILLFSALHTTLIGGKIPPASATATAKAQSATATAQTVATFIANHSLFIENNYQQFTLSINPQGLLGGSQNAVSSVEQQVRNETLLKGRSVALTMVYGGAPTDSDVTQAITISEKVSSILNKLGQQGFAFSRTSYYNPLFRLGASPSEVTVDVFLFTSKAPASLRIGPQYHSFTIHINNPTALLNNNSTEIADVEQQVKNQSLLQGHEVGLAIVYGGAPTDGNIENALQISTKVYTVLSNLGRQRFAFSQASYYAPLYILGGSLDTVKIDIYFYE